MIEDLFITRKRKKWKFAYFDKWANCMQASKIEPGQWATYFPRQRPLVVEVGAGTADLSMELARRHTERNFIAIDVKSDRLYTGAKTALQEGLTNIVFVRAQLREMSQLFASHSIAELWMTFPDPFPRRKQAKHRLTHPNFLKTYKQLLSKNGILRFKTDNRELFMWSLEQMVGGDWHIDELSFDLHKSALPGSYMITTRYERAFMAQAIPINFCTVQPRR